MRERRRPLGARAPRQARRRDLLGAALLLGGLGLPVSGAGARGPAALPEALRAGGVLLLRHALAPGSFDPPQFRLGDCSTQRNLDEAGRAQARRLGAWLRAQGLVPARVRSSPWCRCLDTAQIAFGQAEPWPALGSPHGRGEDTTTEALAALQAGLREASGQPGRLEVWVSHQFVLTAWAGEGAASGAGLLLRPRAGGDRPEISARFPAL